MCTLSSKLLKITIVFVISFMMSGMSALLIASDRATSTGRAGASEAPPAAGGDASLHNLKRPELNSSPTETLKSSRPGTQARKSGKAVQRVSFTRSLAESGNIPGYSRVIAHNVGYDSSTNGITTGDGNPYAPTIYISEGETVTFKGQYSAATHTFGNLSRTDSYVQIEDPSLHPGADVCGLADSLLAHRYDAIEKNEITGPVRKGVSGIFALGAEDAGEGFYEAPAGQGCNVLVPKGAPAGHVFVEVASADDPAHVTHKLCQLMDLTGDEPVPSRYGTNLLLNSTWNNEDITGAVIRINWKDLQKYDPVTKAIVFDWTRLDAEFNQAAKRGKVIFLELLAGDGIPDWVFDDFSFLNPIKVGPAGAGRVVPITLRDHNSAGTGPGWVRKNGSPSDPNYTSLVENLIKEVVNHLRNDSRFFQALGSLKVTGTNFMTGEMRLQKNCTDDGSCPNCWCNTEIWQNPLGTFLPPYSGAINNSEATRGGGYTELGMYAFVQKIENRIFQETQGQKSLIFMLIQAGFPRVTGAGNYWRDSTQSGGPVNGTIQTVNLLQYGRQGLFNAPSGNLQNSQVGQLFVPQHAGLQTLPQDQLDTYPACIQQTTPVFAAKYGKFEAPMPIWGSSSSEGCPNPYAVDESYQGQLIGFQTNNPNVENNPTAVSTPNDLDSTLWNGTANSKMIFWEAYEKVLWKAAIEKGTGPSALPLSTSNYFSSMGRDYQKNLNYWGNELHRRRTALASVALGDPFFANFADPFPTVHSVKFDKDLSPGEIKKYFFINPARCATATGPKYGTIVVTGTAK